MKPKNYVQNTYNQISQEFSQTRKAPWPELTIFKKYLKKNTKILDVGCGNGRFYQYIQSLNCQYTGLDISQNLLKEAQNKYPNINFWQDDMRTMATVADQKFDAIFFIASFHHLDTEEDRLITLKKAQKLLKQDGKIFLTNWNLFQKKYRKYLWQSFYQSWVSSLKWNDTFIPFTSTNKKKTYLRYYHAFTPWELKKLFKKADLKIEKDFYLKKDQFTRNWLESNNLSYVLKK